ncbi:hypothetical protein BJ875DRAFT_95839 [Amylocarpus encephaloides]|uniref:Glucose-inducible SAM-dependent methyltransferase Rrg1 n=1 Tax=Amylocarpus encephaloides TaxID=45428 RepID=A0A9P7YQV4_9HELO|nr:hypothetical protein BJ875DRAFT_95839 [Amylocarpus encephaloides]
MGSISTHVLDLPLLKSQPSFETIRKSLESLTLPPSTWSSTPAVPPVEAENTPLTSRYLTAILKNPFDWLFSHPQGMSVDEQRDILHDLASQRLTERCGRSAQGEMSRTWTLPATSNHESAVDIVIREPSLTGDDLGLKTWGTAWAMAQILPRLRTDYLSHLFPEAPSPTRGKQDGAGGCGSETKGGTPPPPAILELGSGTGLLGLSATLTLHAPVLLTDLPTILPNLHHNIALNTPLLASHSASAHAEPLDWSAVHTGAAPQVPLIVVSDPLYSPDHPRLVGRAISVHLLPDPSSRVLLAVPLRDAATRALLLDLRGRLRLHGFELLGAGEEICRDDWAASRGHGRDDEEIRCWWGVWRWQSERWKFAV